MAGVRRSGCQGGSLPACEQTAGHKGDGLEADREYSDRANAATEGSKLQGGFGTGRCTRMNNDISK